MKWFLLLPINWLFVALSYVLTPIVVLFCDEEGELPAFLKYFQTWDDSCYAEQMATESAPKLLRYDWKSKYFTAEADIPDTGRTRKYSVKYPWVTFSIAERIKRYLCAVLWLWRNPAYGFAFYLLGADVDIDAVRWADIDSAARVGYDQGNKSLWSLAWSLKDSQRINKYIRKSFYVGWKIPEGSGIVRCMMANRITFRFGCD